MKKFFNEKTAEIFVFLVVIFQYFFVPADFRLIYFVLAMIYFVLADIRWEIKNFKKIFERERGKFE